MTDSQDTKEAELLNSACRILKSSNNSFEVKPWREIMPKAQANQKQAAMKAAQKKLGIKPPKEAPKELGTSLAVSGEGQSDTVDTLPQDEANMQAVPLHAGRRATDPIIGYVPEHLQHAPGMEAGDSQGQNDVVESGFSIFNQSQKGRPMTAAEKTPSSNFPEKRASPEQAAKEAATKQAIADKAERKAAAEQRATEAKVAREKAAAERAERIKANADAKAARAEELKAAGRTYVGSMTQLADRVKQGAYVKSLTGQLRSTDELAVALDAVPAANVVQLGLKALKLDVNPYAALNIGQQSMNLRNRMRGAIKKGTLTLDEVKWIRDVNNYATAEAEKAAKAEAKAAKAKAAEEAKAVKIAADQKALEEKHAKEAEALKAPVTEKAKPAKKTAPAQASA